MDQIIDLTNVVSFTPVERFQDVMDRENAASWPPEAKELLRRGTAEERHNSRVRRCTQVALVVAGKIDPYERCDGEIADLLLRAGWQGVGGRLDLGAEIPGGNRRSARCWPWSQACGKGRANATDGPAWCQALYSAQASLRTQVAGDYDKPSGMMMALETILQWAEAMNQSAWAEDVRDHLRAIAARQLFLSYVEHRPFWAEVYSACCYPLTHEAAFALRVNLEKRQAATAESNAPQGDDAEVTIAVWRAED